MDSAVAERSAEHAGSWLVSDGDGTSRVEASAMDARGAWAAGKVRGRNLLFPMLSAPSPKQNFSSLCSLQLGEL